MGEERGPAELLGVLISSGFCKINYWKRNIEREMGEERDQQRCYES